MRHGERDHPNWYESKRNRAKYLLSLIRYCCGFADTAQIYSESETQDLKLANPENGVCGMWNTV
jgi:hypothetical protein